MDSSIKVCGPDVTKQIAQIWQKIIDDFRTWPQASKQRAADTLFSLNPFDFNSWDTLPLFRGNSDWLRDPRLNTLPCGVPLRPGTDEDEDTCSDTVQVGGQCWLNGTVNYGTFGIMAKLCENLIMGAHAQATARIRTYKNTSSALPLAWFNTTFHDGPAGVPKAQSDRSSCACSCSADGSVVNWDYVWEPIKPRDSRGKYALYDPAKEPRLNLPELPKPWLTPAPPPAPIYQGQFGPPAPKVYVVLQGDTLQSIAGKREIYGDSTQWTRIYAVNKHVIGHNPNIIRRGQQLFIP